MLLGMKFGCRLIMIRVVWCRLMLGMWVGCEGRVFDDVLLLFIEVSVRIWFLCGVYCL